MSKILSFPQRERSERVGLSTCVKHGHVAQSAQPQLVSFLKSPAVNMKMKMRNAPKLAKYASDHFGPEDRPHLNFNFKGGGKSAYCPISEGSPFSLAGWLFPSLSHRMWRVSSAP